jgi:hypothetical protein
MLKLINKKQEEMENENRYINIEKVGQGTYGAVYKSRDTVSKDVSFDLMLRWSL